VFRQRLYNDSQNTFNLLTQRAYSFLEGSVKYYAHNPNCWLVIADSVAYFEPYTFGQPPRSMPSESRRFGPYMPVLKFEQSSEAETFDILGNHFWNLWLASDTGLVHFTEKWENRSIFIQEIFARRLDWLSHVFSARGWGYGLKADAERRKWPRRPCGSKQPVMVQLTT